MKTKMTIVLAAILFGMAACKKDNTAPDTKGFRWSENGSSTELVGDSAWVNQSYNTIIAQKGGSTKIEINLAALAPATYTVSSSTQNAVTFIIGTSTHIANSGTVVISQNSDNKLSGTFDVSESGVTGTYRVNGKFTEIALRP